MWCCAVPEPPVTHGPLHGKYLQLHDALRPWVTLAVSLVLRVMLSGVFPSSLRVPLGSSTGGQKTEKKRVKGQHPWNIHHRGGLCPLRILMLKL